MDVSSLDIVKTVVQDSPHKLFIGGLPCDRSEDQVHALTVILMCPAKEMACSGNANHPHCRLGHGISCSTHAMALFKSSVNL